MPTKTSFFAYQKLVPFRLDNNTIYRYTTDNDISYYIVREKGNSTMFGRINRDFAFQGQGGDWGGWTPPWLQDDEGPRGPRGRHGGHRGPFGRQQGPLGGGPRFFGRRGPFGGRPDARFFEMRRGRGPFGGGPFGPGAPFGPEGPAEGRRFFGRGDMKFALLGLLQERPMHGYEMIKALEERSGGFYAPSAGSVYPTLQLLEDRGFVTVNETEGKKVYSITDSGRATLAERQEKDEEFAGPRWGRGFGPGGHGGPGGRPEMQALRGETAEVARLFIIAGRKTFENPEQLAQLRSIIERTRKELSDMIYGTGTKQE